MLAELRVRNYALIEDLAVEFGPGLNVITGETGAGKSIVLGALSLVLGERPDPTMIRAGSNSAQVEARFEDVAGVIQDQTRELGLDVPADSNELLLRRRAERGGRSTAWANDSGITVTALRALGDRLVDLHGQHQHQYLLRTEVHCGILDACAGLVDEVARFAAGLSQLRNLEADLARLRAEIEDRRQRRDLTEYQHRELNEASTRAGEYQELTQERELLASAEQRYAIAREAEALLSEQDGAAAELLAAAARRLAELGRVDPAAGDWSKSLTEAESVVDDIWRQLVRYREGIDFSPERLEEVTRRLFRLDKLAAKHGVEPDELPALSDRLRAELDSAEIDETRCTELKQQVEQAGAGLLEAAARLSTRRARAARRLEKGLVTEFAALGLEKARLAVNVCPPAEPAMTALGPEGYDRVEFLFSANPGEELRPLHKIASGGELSRIMLALKNVLADGDPVATMVFDEIDVGIGGRVAEAVGRRLLGLARRRQVVCITHLPQIAKYAQRHLLASKSTRAGRTTTALRELDADARVRELARMVAGQQLTKTSIAHARAMLAEAGADGD